MSRDDPQTKIRFPVELKSRLIEAARKNDRTINAEIINRIERSFVEVASELPDGVAAMQIAAIHAMLTELHAAVKTPSPAKFPFSTKK